MTYLHTLTDEELLSEFRFRRDPIVTTEMEEVLAERLESATDFVALYEPLSEVAEDVDLEDLKSVCASLSNSMFSGSQAAELIDILADAGIDPTPTTFNDFADDLRNFIKNMEKD